MCHQSSTRFVAVYGSLKKGFYNHRYHLGNQRFVGDYTVCGFDMFNMGSYPMIVQGDGSVAVELYEVDDASFASLDRLEGFPHFYDRKKVNARLTNGLAIKAWIYFGRPEQVQGCPQVTSGVWTEDF